MSSFLLSAAFPVQAASFGVFLNTNPNPAVVAPGGQVTINWSVSWGATPKIPYNCSAPGLGNFSIDSDLGGGGGKAGTFGTLTFNVSNSYTLTCVANDGEAVASNLAAITVSSAPVVSVSASPGDLPAGGGSVIVTWTVGQATTCTPSEGTTAWRALSGMQTGGALQFGVSAPTVFTLTCSNAAGVSATSSTIVTIGGTPPPPPPTVPGCGNYKVDPGEECDSVVAGVNALGPCPAVCSTTCTLNNCPVENPTGYLTVDKQVVLKGEAVTFNWDITKGGVPYQCNMLSNDPNWNDGYASPSGSRTFVPSMGGVNAPGTYNYTLCSSVQNTPFFQVQIKVTDPPVISVFKAEPDPIDSGQSTKLKWTVANAPQGCTLWKGSVPDGNNILWSGNPTTTPEFSVSPTTSTTYLLECYNPIVNATNNIVGTDKAQKKTTVTVNGTPDPDDMVAKVTMCATRLSLSSSDPDTSKRMTTVQFSAKDALSCSLSNTGSDSGWQGASPSLSGYQNSFFPTSAITFTANCVGANNKAVSKSISIAVNGQGSAQGTVCGSSGGTGGGGTETPPTTSLTCGQGACQQKNCQPGYNPTQESCNSGTGSCCVAATVIPPTILSAPWSNPLDFNTVEGLLDKILSYLQGIIVILSLIMIVIGSIVYMTAGGNDSKLSTGKLIITASLIGLALALAAPSFLKQIGDILGWSNDQVNQTSVQSSKTLLEILETALNFLLSIVGLIAIIMLVVGGMMYMLAAGDEKRMETGKTIVTYSLIGIAVSLAALVIVGQVVGFFS